MRPNNERGIRVSEKALLERTLQRHFLLRRASRDPGIEIAVDRWRLYPSNPTVLKITKHTVQVVGLRLVVNVVLDENVVGVSVGIQPGVHVASFRLSLERRRGLVV